MMAHTTALRTDHRAACRCGKVSPDYVGHYPDLDITRLDRMAETWADTHRSVKHGTAQAWVFQVVVQAPRMGGNLYALDPWWKPVEVARVVATWYEPAGRAYFGPDAQINRDTRRIRHGKRVGYGTGEHDVYDASGKFLGWVCES